MFENFMELYLQGKKQADEWESFLNEEKRMMPETPDHDIIGLTKDEFIDLKEKTRNIQFFAFKLKYRKDVIHVWNGSYIKFAFQYDLSEPHFEYGWVDAIDRTGTLIRVQCDDALDGQRALTVRLVDVLEVFPAKERKLIFYKTMTCASCEKCPRQTNDFPSDCPKYDFFNAILNKQRKDEEFFNEYFKLIGEKK